MIKTLTLIGRFLLFLLVFLAGVWVGHKFFSGAIFKQEVEEEGQVLLEKIESVSKLITVEGTFSELYTYKELNSFFGVRYTGKKAVVRVNGLVSVGYDMEKVKWTLDPENKIIYLEGLPEPEILSIDHDLEYFDIDEGTFAYLFDRFSKEDYTKINDNAKGLIQKKAEESELLVKASEAGLQRVDVIRFLVEGAGWTLEVNREPTIKGIRKPAKDTIPG